jgi:3-hydroxymyristoyl/3-hydroxydecanoyl-(acyl carrier protein) dehydratase
MSATDNNGRQLPGEAGWFIRRPRQKPDGTIRASARIAAASSWFKGHFPGEPILPGIAQLELVSQAVQAVSDAPLRVAGMRRVRFKQVVRPDDKLEITVNPPTRGRTGFAFRVLVENSVVCSGTLDMV